MRSRGRRAGAINLWICAPRARYYGRKLPHLFTSRRRTQIDGEWTDWTTYCCWCGLDESPVR